MTSDIRLPLAYYDDSIRLGAHEDAAPSFTPPLRSRMARMHPIDERLKPYEASDGDLANASSRIHGLQSGQGLTLEEQLRSDCEEVHSETASSTPAGYVYFGQFLSHDLAFEPTQGFELGVRSPRTFGFDLDSLYGAGPTAHPHLYDRHSPAKLALHPSGANRSRMQWDLERNGRGTACIEDPRNDENVLVSQIHAAMARSHNALVDAFQRRGEPYSRGPSEWFAAARNALTRLYHWVIATDWLPRFLHDVDANRLKAGIRTYELHIFKGGPARLTPEYAYAACRFGHAMVRPTYRLNGLRRELPILPYGEQPPHEHLTMFRPLPPDWFLDWRLFFTMRKSQLERVERLRGALSTLLFGSQRNPVQFARKIRPRLSRRLALLPVIRGANANRQMLAYRTLRTGMEHGLPESSELAASLGMNSVTTVTGALWSSLLAEAGSASGGERLGPLGSRIVGDTMVGALLADPEGCVHDAGFGPRCVHEADASFDLPELLMLGDAENEALDAWLRSL